MSKKHIPGVTGVCLAMRRLYIYPTSIDVPITRLAEDDEPAEPGTERLGNILGYLDDKRYTIDIQRPSKLYSN